MRIIGRKENINLPEWDMYAIEAKVDTGAYGCALHCHHVEVVTQDDEEVLRFKLLDPHHPEYDDRFVYARQFSRKRVKNSGGQVEHRYSIKTTVRLFNKKYRTEFSLTDRQKMRYPVLIGRKFLNKRFLVDVSQQDLSYQQTNPSGGNHNTQAF